MQQRRGVPRDGGVSNHQNSYNYQNAQYQKYAANGVQNSGAKARHHHHHDSKVYVGGLPPQINEAQLRARMSQFGTVVQANIIYDEHGNSKGFGFVSFRNSEEAKSALGIIDMFGKSVEVKYSNKNTHAHQPDFRYRNTAGDYPSSERYSSNATNPYPYQQPQRLYKTPEHEFVHELDQPESAFHDGYPKPSLSGSALNQIAQTQLSPLNPSPKALSKKMLRNSSQQFEYLSSDKESQKVHTPSEKHQNTSEESTRYAESIETESITRGNQSVSKGGPELQSRSPAFSETFSAPVGVLSQKRPEEPHRTISKHSNPYHPPVNSLPSVLPANTAISPHITPLDYNAHSFGIYFNPQQNLYTQPGMGFMMNQFMNFSPLYEPLPPIEFPPQGTTPASEDSPSQPAVETRINFYTFPGRV